MCTELSTEIEDSDVLKNMSNHLRNLADEVSLVVSAVSKITKRVDPPPSMTIIQDLQKMDELHQSLFDLAQLTDAMASDPRQRESRFRDLKLAKTRALLCGDKMTHFSDDGAVDLF